MKLVNGSFKLGFVGGGGFSFYFGCGRRWGNNLERGWVVTKSGGWMVVVG